MALPLLPGLTPSEVAFLCEMELVTVIPRQRLEGLQLLGVSRTHKQTKMQQPQYVASRFYIDRRLQLTAADLDVSFRALYLPYNHPEERTFRYG
jgi:hypothetical protein